MLADSFRNYKGIAWSDPKIKKAFSREQQAMGFIAMHRRFVVAVLAIAAGGGQASAAALSAADQAQLRAKIEQQLVSLQRSPSLVRSFIRAPCVAYIADC